MIAKKITLIVSLAGLTVLAGAPVSAQVCSPPPSGIVSWWPGEGDARDLIGGNPGTVMGAATFAPSFIGQGFKFGGLPSDIVTVGNPANLQLQSFTIEAWISRSSTAASSFTVGGGCLFCHGLGGYAFGFLDDGRLFLSKIGVNIIDSGDLRVTDLNFHHVAVTKSGSTVIFYVDGVATTGPAYDPGFVFTTGAAIGAGTHNLSGFLGIVDEVAFYDRALTADEIQAIFNAGSAGKCTPEQPPASKAQFEALQREGQRQANDADIREPASARISPSVSSRAASSRNSATASRSRELAWLGESPQLEISSSGE